MSPDGQPYSLDAAASLYPGKRFVMLVVWGGVFARIFFYFVGEVIEFVVPSEDWLVSRLITSFCKTRPASVRVYYLVSVEFRF